MKDTRVQKYMSDCGIMSRRAAEKEIEDGKVLVNGEVCSLGDKIDTEKDVVSYLGKTVCKKRGEKYTYIMLNKPRGFVTTMCDEKGRRCVAELVADAGVRVYPVGRLDRESEGLLLMTNDGALTERLTHPRHEIPKVYRVGIAGALTNAQIRALGEPMELDGYKLAPVGIELEDRDDERTYLIITLYEGRNRQIRRMCEKCDMEVISLKRIAIGNLTIDGVKRGKWRYLNKEEVDYLKGEQSEEEQEER